MYLYAYALVKFAYTNISFLIHKFFLQIFIHEIYFGFQLKKNNISLKHVFNHLITTDLFHILFHMGKQIIFFFKPADAITNCLHRQSKLLQIFPRSLRPLVFYKSILNPNCTNYTCSLTSRLKNGF